MIIHLDDCDVLIEIKLLIGNESKQVFHLKNNLIFVNHVQRTKYTSTNEIYK
jgi:hypothetical protein